jgi:peptidyl-prolyl cis-trans isomerase D
MLRNIRKNLQGTIAKVIVAIIVVPFALFGIESLLSGGGVQYVAEVNGERVSAMELQQQVNQQKRRLLMSLGDSIDPAMLDDQMLAGPALEFIIQKTLMMQAAGDYGMTVSDQRLGSYIGDMEVFQQNGSFDPALFRRVVSDQGYTPAGFQEALRDDLIMTQLRSGVAGSTFATPAEIDLMARIQQQRRDIRYMVLPLEQFRSDAEVSEEDIQSWYEQNQADYLTEESVDLAYIELTADDFRAPADEEQLRELYEEERDSFVQAEERRVAHILFAREADESDEAFSLRVEGARERLAGGADFGELAEEVSDDVGSAAIGGDLGYTSGEVFPPEMEEAIAALAAGDVSGPVETDAGIHLILVSEVREGKTRSFDEVRGELESRVQDQQASLELVKTVESLRDLVFNAEGLADPAVELELELERENNVTRNQSEGLFANSRLIAAAFSGDVLNEGYNSEVIEIDAEHFIVLQVLEHREPALKPLLDVRDNIVASLREDIARDAIRSQAKALLQSLRDGASVEALAQENDYDWQVELATDRNNPSVPPALLERAFELPEPQADNSVFEFVQNSEGDIELFELVRVVPGALDELNPGQRQLIERQLINEYGQRTDQHYQEALRGSADISRS